MKIKCFINLLWVVLIVTEGRAQTALPTNFMQKDYQKGKNKYKDNVTSDTTKKLHKLFVPASEIDTTKPIYLLPTCFEYASLFIDDSTKFVQTNAITYSDSLNNVALYSEIAADYLGPVRVSVGVTLSYPKSGSDSVQETAVTKEKFVQTFGTGGGVLNLNAGLPLYYLSLGPITSDMVLGPRFGFMPPGFGVSSGGFAVNSSIADEMQMHIVTVKKVFDISGDSRLSYNWANSPFYDMLGLTGSQRKSFWLNSYTLGIIVANKFSLSYTGFWGTSYISTRIKSSVAFTVDANF